MQVIGWCEGRDPDSFGWSFVDEEGTFRVSCVEIDECESREEAIDLGIPSDVLDEYEKSGWQSNESYGFGLTGWLQDSGANDRMTI